MGNLIYYLLRGKSLNRVLFNEVVDKNIPELGGVTLDLAGIRHASYRKLLEGRVPTGSKVYTVNLGMDANPELLADLNRSLPFMDKCCNNVLLFNVISILEDPQQVINECFRVLAPSGKFFMLSPYLSAEARDPYDYQRISTQGIMRYYKNAGFVNVKVIPYGERFTTSANLIFSPLVNKPVINLLIACTVFPTAILLDRLIPESLRERSPAPIGYLAIGTKPG